MRRMFDIDNRVDDPKFDESRCSRLIKRDRRDIVGEIVNFGFDSLATRSNIAMRSKLLQHECILMPRLDRHHHGLD